MIVSPRRSLPVPSGYSLWPEKQALIGLSALPVRKPKTVAERAPDFCIMRAWLQAQLAHPGDTDAAVAAVETAVRSLKDPAYRLLSKYYYRVPAHVRPLLGQRDGDGLRALLGCWVGSGDQAVFQEGLAGLSAREEEAYRLKIHGWSPSAIAHQMTAPRQRFDRRLWIRVETVYQYCWRAKCKVLETFGLPMSSEDEEDAI